MRDPVLYRIRHAHHHRTGDAWCIYPMYDYAHPLSDAIEGITHSLCTLEYGITVRSTTGASTGGDRAPAEADRVRAAQPELHGDEQAQAAAAGREATYRAGTIRACRPSRACAAAATRRNRSATSAARRRGQEGERDRRRAPRALRARGSQQAAPRAMAVLRPLKLVLTNYAEGPVEHMDVVNNPEDPAAGTRKVAFSREIYIERDDFMEDPPKKFFRLAPGREVRLRNAYLVTCTEVVKDAAGDIVELRGTYDPATRGGDAPDGRKVKARSTGCRRRTPRPARCACTTGCSRRKIRMALASKTGVEFTSLINPASFEGAHRLPAGADAGRRGARARASSSSAWATSAPTWIRGPTRRSSTAPCRSRTRGPGRPPATPSDAGNATTRARTLCASRLSGDPASARAHWCASSPTSTTTARTAKVRRASGIPRVLRGHRRRPQSHWGDRVLRAALRRELPRRRRSRHRGPGDLLRGRPDHARGPHPRIPGRPITTGCARVAASGEAGGPTGSSCSPRAAPPSNGRSSAKSRARGRREHGAPLPGDRRGVPPPRSLDPTAAVVIDRDGREFHER